MLFGIKAVRPGNSKIADLDAMKSEPVSIRLFGRDHILKPLSIEQFLTFSSACLNLEALKNSESKSPVPLILDAYHEVISSALDSISREDLNEMSIQQIGALIQLINETVTGKIFTEKKTLAQATN